jgi:hypothetical protein
MPAAVPRTPKSQAPRPAVTTPATTQTPRAASTVPAVIAPGRPAVGVGAKAPQGEVAPGVLEIKGMPEFKPPAPVAEFLDSRKSSTINARFGSLAQGPIEVRTVSKGKYRIRKQPLVLNHPALARVAEFAPGLTPALSIGLDDSNRVSGEVVLAAGQKVERISQQIQKMPEILGLAGFTIGTLPTITNTIEGGSLHLGLKGVPIKLGSAFSGKFDLDLIDTSVSFTGNVAIAVKGLANGTLNLQRAHNGLITGRAAVGLTLPKNISGNVDVAWDGVTITGIGKVGYKGEKFSGEVTLQMMEKNQAESLAKAKKAPPAATPRPAPAVANKTPSRIDYVVFGEGDLTFSFTEWLNGTAHVIIDPKGNLTVIGEIKPQKEFVLFEQKDYIRPLFKFEARATYGIPVVGNLFIFANVGMDLFAKLGPAKFYNIVIAGTYSTDPGVAKNFSIRGSLNISAGAGARLRADAGVGLELLAHDIKAGAGLMGIAGIKAYAEATPEVGYREKAAEGQDLKGEWFIRGDLEIAAQPFLGLSGDLFVEIDAPWWSPVPDKKWTWPLFSKEWPLGSSLGMLVSVDYVFGSGQWPKFDLKPVEFDSNKFMTALYEDKAKSGSGKELEQKGKWQEKNAGVTTAPPKTSPKGSASRGKLEAAAAPKSKRVSGGGRSKDDRKVDPNAKTKDGKTVKQLQDEAAKKGKGPKGKAGERTEEQKKSDLDRGVAEADALVKRVKKEGKIKSGLAAIKTKYKMTSLELVVVSKGKDTEKVHIHGVVNPAKDGPDETIDTDTPISADERATIASIAGGSKQLAKLDAIIAGGGQQAKINAEVAVIRTTLVALKQGKNVKYIGLDLYKRGESEKITEIDVLTEDEMVEVKTGDYSLETKLSGRDMNQFTNLKRFFEQKIVVVDENGKLINAPRKFVYQFTKPISKELDSWLKQKGVTEVRSPR